MRPPQQRHFLTLEDDQPQSPADELSRVKCLKRKQVSTLGTLPLNGLPIERRVLLNSVLIRVLFGPAVPPLQFV